MEAVEIFKLVQQFLKYAEKLAIKHSQFYISDSRVIKEYLENKYHIYSEYIPYGADVFTDQEREQLDTKEALKEDYFLLMARMEPENNIETILEGFNNSNSRKKFKVLGDTGNRFGKFIKHRFGNDERIQFKGSILIRRKCGHYKTIPTCIFMGTALAAQTRPC